MTIWKKFYKSAKICVNYRFVSPENFCKIETFLKIFSKLEHFSKIETFLVYFLPYFLQNFLFYKNVYKNENPNIFSYVGNLQKILWLNGEIAICFCWHVYCSVFLQTLMSIISYSSPLLHPQKTIKTVTTHVCNYMW